MQTNIGIDWLFWVPILANIHPDTSYEITRTVVNSSYWEPIDSVHNVQIKLTVALSSFT